MSEYDEYKKDRQELIESRKVKMSTPDGGAGMIKQDYVPLKPKTFKEKWINYWYHYKGLTFGSAFAAILVFMFVWQIATKTVYDGKMMIVSELPFETITEDLEKTLIDFTDDFTGNGKLDVSITPIQQDYSAEGTMQPEMVQANFVKLSAGISTLETFIYMVDDKSYHALKEMELQFMDLSDSLEIQNLTGEPAYTDRYPLRGTKLAAELEIENVAEDMYLCFIDYESFDEKRQNKKEVKTNFSRDMQFFKSLVNFG